jgi:TIR domain
VTPTIFISYRRMESAAYARNIADALRQAFPDAKVFHDISSVGGGEDFLHAIDQAVDASKVTLVVIGPAWLARESAGAQPRIFAEEDYVRHEIVRGLHREGAVVIPVTVGGARMPSASELPDVLKSFARLHAVELTDLRWEYDMARLVAAIASATKMTPTKRLSSQRKLQIALGAVMLLVILALGVRAILPTRVASSEDVFQMVRDLGFKPNTRVLTPLEPGTVIHIAGFPDASPKVMMWGSDCFPGIASREGDKILFGADADAGLSVGASGLGHLLRRSLSIEQAAATVSLRFGDVHKLTFAKGELSGRFADTCVEAMRRAIEAGDPWESFATIDETLVADTIAITIDWKRDSVPTLREDALIELRSAFATPTVTAGKAESSDLVNVAHVDASRSVMTIKRRIVLGYTARPMQPAAR